MRRHLRIGIDTGGTFTDVVAFDETTGQLATTKTPSTPQDPADGFMDGIGKVLAMLGAAGEAVSSVSHGTTVATNALLEDRVDDLGFITTTGYRFVLEIARQSVPDGYGNSYFWVKPDRIVPVHLVREVGGRLDHRGHEVRPFDEDEAVAAARWFRNRRIATVGVCFLHAYANGEHERRMRDVLAREHPDCVVSISSDVLREYREYERSVTTLVDASVKPKVTRYIVGIADRLEAFTGVQADAGVPFSIMKSNGGVMSAHQVVHQPITTVLSGPAAGALGAAMIAAAAGHERVLTLDGGGTSTDVSVAVEGEPTLTTEGSIGRYPSKIPMVDIVTVGAGGGSVAWISPEGTLKVGPRSAGADPGPLCYGKGGTEATITDAHVFLGRIPPHLLGGEIPLDVEAARRGLTELAAALGRGMADAAGGGGAGGGMTLETCATGILEISAWNQANAIRQITVKRGLDVREFAMAAFGGSGPLLVCRLLDILGLRAAIVPVDPGNVSAFGLLTVDVKNDYVQTHVVRHADLDTGEVGGIYAALEAQAASALEREGFSADRHRFLRTADLRYFGQASEVRVPAPAGPVDTRFVHAVVSAFHDGHERLYGYCYRDDPRHAVEWVNLRVSGIGPIRRPELARLDTGVGDVDRACTGTRPVYFPAHDVGPGGPASGWSDTPLYRRDDLRAGDRVDGPAVLEEYGSTIPVHPGYTAAVDELANVVVTRSRA